MTTPPSVQLPFTTSHAFIIGINDYEQLAPLNTAVSDARALAEALEKDHGYRVHPPLLNATRADLMQLLEQDVPNLVNAQDRVLFYFAGHGIALDSDDDPKGYLVPVDAQPGDNATLVAMDDFHGAITKLPCQHGMLILDCCFAGAFKWSTGFRDVLFDLPGIIYEERFYQYAQDPAWQVITSSASDQKAMDVLSDRTLGMRSEAEGEHSPFALALLEGLAGAADTVPKDSGDGVITATELYTYLRDRVEDATTEAGKRQSPSMFSLQRHDKGQYIFLAPNHRLNLPPIPRRNPYMGLKSYNEDDRALFYGRDRVIAALRELATRQPLVVVSGASGTGKSSVIKAGLLPLLRQEGRHILPVLRPGKEPMDAWQSVEAELSTALRQNEQCVLIVDQYEELLTQCLVPADRVAFENRLADLIRAHFSLCIILSIRSDFEPQFEGSPLAEWWQAGRYTVPVFSQDELREVIVKPTTQEVLFFEPDTLVDKLIEAVNQAPGALPLLSFTLSELYHAYLNSGRTNRAFTLEDYERLGGVIGALRTRANAIYDDLDRAHQDSMRKLMLRMVALEAGELASRRVASKDLIFSDSKETERLEAIAQQLVGARLLATGLDKEGETYYEPAHDALVRAWVRLWEWIKAQGESRMDLMYKLSLAVRDYENNPTPEYLWNDDPRLDLLLLDLREKGHNFNAAEERFLQKSSDLRQRNKRRRRGIVATVMVGLLSLALFAFYEQGIAKSALVQADESAKEARLQADSARAAQDRAETFSQYAQEQRDSALEANQRAIESGNEARRQAGIALMERDRARRALNAAERNLITAKSAQTAANAREQMTEDPTVALNLALAAYKLFPSDETSKALRDMHRRRKGSYYKRKFHAHNGIVNGITYSPDGTKLLTAGKDSIVRIWDTDGKLLRSFPRQENEITRARFSPSGDTILVGVYNGIIQLWRTEGEKISSFRAYGDKLSEVYFSPDGKTILTNAYYGNAKLWSLNGDEIKSFNGTDGPVEISPNGKQVLTKGYSNALILSDVNSSASREIPTAKQVIYTFSFSPDGKYVVAGGSNNIISLTNLENDEVSTYDGKTDKLRSLIFSPDGNKLISRSDTEGNSKLWRLPEERHWNNFKDHAWDLRWQTNVDSNRVMAVSFSPNGQQFVTGEEKGTVHVWDVEHDLPVFDNGEYIEEASFFPDASKMLMVSGNRVQAQRGMRQPFYMGWSQFGVNTSVGSPIAKAWSVSGELLSEFIGHEDWIKGAVISGNGQRVVTGSLDETVKIWDASGRLIQSFSIDQAALDVDISQDGEKIITVGRDSTIKIWSMSGQLLNTVRGHKDVISCVTFSPDGRTFVTGSHDKTVRIWDLKGNAIAELTGHTSKIFDVSISPDGATIASASIDGTTKLWSRNGRALATLPEFENKEMLSVTFSPGGKTVLTGSEEYVRLWDLSGRLIRLYEQGGRSINFSPDGGMIIAVKDQEARLLRNIYGQYTNGTLWNHVHQLTPAERAEYGIDWEY